MLEEQHPMTPVPMGGTVQICFMSPCGTQWVVYEVTDRSTESGRALIFESDETWRRVRRYPAHWRELDAAALWALSWRR